MICKRNYITVKQECVSTQQRTNHDAPELRLQDESLPFHVPGSEHHRSLAVLRNIVLSHPVELTSTFHGG